MLLFDAATNNNAVTPIFSSAAVSLPARSSDRGSRKPATRENTRTQTHTPGLNHMGDLARLVLLRHDLVAARRAKRRSK
jgi:hypothetical protein